MTDRYANIRRALEMGPTPGPWRVNTSGVGVKGGKVELTEFYVYNPAIVDDVAIAADIIDPTTCKPSEANAAHIAACDPDTIRALLAERDALARENEALRRCAIKYLGWLNIITKPLDEALREDMADPDMCGDAAIAAANGGSND